jgi:hypothetical protein
MPYLVCFFTTQWQSFLSSKRLRKLPVQLVANHAKMIIKTVAATVKVTVAESAAAIVTIARKAVTVDVEAEAAIAFRAVESKVKVVASEETEEMTTDLAPTKVTWKAQAQTKV